LATLRFCTLVNIYSNTGSLVGYKTPEYEG